MSLGADPRKLDYFRELPRNWKQKKQFLFMKNAIFFFTPSTVRTFFWALPKPPKWWSKVAPKNTQTDDKSHVLSTLPVKKSYGHCNSRRYGEIGAALEDSARASKIGFLDGTVEIVFFFSEPSPIRPRTKNYSFLKEILIENRFFFVSEPAPIQPRTKND